MFSCVANASIVVDAYQVRTIHTRCRFAHPQERPLYAGVVFFGRLLYAPAYECDKLRHRSTLTVFFSWHSFPHGRSSNCRSVQSGLEKAPGVVARLKALGASVEGLLSAEESAVLESLPSSMAGPKTTPVTPGSFRLMQKIVTPGSGWPKK